MRVYFLIIVAAIFLLFQSCEQDIGIAEDVRINQLQSMGSHNSYRLKTDSALFALSQNLYDSGVIPQDLNPREWDYTHEKLDVQFGTYQVRSVELDIYNDPDGGRFYNRHGQFILGNPPASNVPELLEPGMKLIHIADMDYNTNYYKLTQALEAIKDWSAANPTHFPITVMIELKEETVADYIGGLGFVEALPFDLEALEAIEQEIKDVFGENLSGVIVPDSVRGNYATLNEAVLNNNWPRLHQARGKVLFVVMASGQLKTDYLSGHEALKGRPLFLFSSAGEPETAFIKFDDPVNNFEEIQQRVREGYMIRTRADAGTIQARDSGDYSRMNTAFSSGAQLVSTDYYKPDYRAYTSSEWSDYRVQVPGGQASRLNPVNGPKEYIGFDLSE